jgi:hypothetical protein
MQHSGGGVHRGGLSLGKLTTAVGSLGAKADPTAAPDTSSDVHLLFIYSYFVYYLFLFTTNAIN